MKVVGTMFFENEKLLIDKPRKRPTYQMIGGKVEEGETTLQAAIRECHEELGDEAIFDEEKFELIMELQQVMELLQYISMYINITENFKEF